MPPKTSHALETWSDLTEGASRSKSLSIKKAYEVEWAE